MKWVSNNLMSIVIAGLLAYMAWQNQYFIGKLDKVLEKQGTEENRLTKHIAVDDERHLEVCKKVDNHETRLTQAEKDIIEQKHKIEMLHK